MTELLNLGRKILSLGLTVAFLILVFLYIINKKGKESNDIDSGTDLYSVVERVIDGDTFELSDGNKVRLLGIDTPEKYESGKLERDSETSGKDKKTIKKLGKIASDYVKNFVEGKKVRLEKEPNYDDKDRYGRLLRYVYLEDGTFVNGKIVRDGFAQVYEKYPVSKLDELREYQKEARENERGLWGEIESLEQFK